VSVKHSFRYGFEWLETGFDRAFGPAWNPLYQLGALGYFFYWVVIVTGIYLYIFFDTSVTGAYASVERLTGVQWYAGGVMRSLHRYASDALVVVMMVHLVREYVMDRFRGTRWWAWITGVPLIWLVFASGISGYWLVWDTLAQYVAIATTEWFDTLPIFGEPIARNFLNQPALDSRFFTLMVFVHIMVPLFLLFVMWLHLQRIARAKSNPPRGLAAGTLAMLVVLSFVYPATSQGPADLDQVPAVLGLDWFYLFGYPLADRFPGLAVWAAFGIGTILLFAVPWMPPAKRRKIAVVDLGNCNGCTRCFQDCPFGAIDMKPRSDGLPFDQEAVVIPDLCASCGICAGACPTSTPFRRVGELAPGIDLAGFTVSELRERVVAAAAPLAGEARVMVFGCDHGTEAAALAGDGVAVVSMPCTGMLPPSFIDFVISRRLADGVFLTGCREGSCHFRLGIQWTNERVERRRDPQLRGRVPDARVARGWVGNVPAGGARKALDAFRTDLRKIGPYMPGENAAARDRAAE
jgi:quinol-cytochrome oxidoreductase complex cytochrome b subunit/coenzyme F420-reducing hydrogenase delta subunit